MFNPVPKPKRVKKKSGLSMSSLDIRWSYLIKLRAGLKSELSNRNLNLNAHHINGKENYTLRYSLLSGICLTEDEHINGIHNPNRAERYRELIKKARGQDIYERLEKVRKNHEVLSLVEIENYLNYHIELLKGRRQGKIYLILKKGEWYAK